MTPQETLIGELQLVLQSAEASAQVMRAWHAGGVRVRREDLHDHRMAVYGQLIDAINVAAPGLGSALHQAMYPLAIHQQDPTPCNTLIR